VSFLFPAREKLALAVERKIMSAFDRFQQYRKRMVDRLSAKGVHPSRTVLFPHWVDTGEIFPLEGPNPFRKELGIQESTSSHSIREAWQEAWPGAAGGRGEPLEALSRLTIYFCGAGPCRQMLADKAKDLSNVTLLPVQPAGRLNDLLNLADIHLLPQLADAADLVMPSKLTGMLASGRAIVATALPRTQLFEVLQGTGMVTPPGGVDAFVSALLRLCGVTRLASPAGPGSQKLRSFSFGPRRDSRAIRTVHDDICGIPLPTPEQSHAQHQEER